jgi:hypothetical protein
VARHKINGLYQDSLITTCRLRPPTSSLASIAPSEAKSERSIRQSLSPAFLDSSLAKAAIEGRPPRGFGVERLIDLPMLWSEQWAALGLRASVRSLI